MTRLIHAAAPAIALALAACSGGDEAATADAADATMSDAPSAAEAEKYARGNEFNPQDGEDVGLPLGMRVFPGATVSEKSDTSVTFTAPDAATAQVVDWYFRKLDMAGFEIDVRGMSEGLGATSADGTVDLTVGESGQYTLTATPAA